MAQERKVRDDEVGAITCFCNGKPDVVYLYVCSVGHTVEQPACRGCNEVYGGYKKLKPSVCTECFAESQAAHRRAFDVREMK